MKAPLRAEMSFGKEKRMIIYYIVAILANVICVAVFSGKIGITEVSALPAFLLCLSAFQGYYFRNHRKKKDFNINNDSELNESEWGVLSVYMSRSYLISLPLYVPFIFFGGTLVKLCSAVVFFAAFAGGAAVYKFKYKNEIAARIESEEAELSEQEKKEELGNI